MANPNVYFSDIVFREMVKERAADDMSERDVENLFLESGLYINHLPGQR